MPTAPAGSRRSISDSDDTGASGAWVRVWDNAVIQATWAGLLFDGTTIETDSWGDLISLVEYLGSGYTIKLPAGTSPTGPLVFNVAVNIVGETYGSVNDASQFETDEGVSCIRHTTTVTAGTLLTFDADTASAQLYGGSLEGVILDGNNFAKKLIRLNSCVGFTVNCLGMKATEIGLEINNDGTGDFTTSGMDFSGWRYRCGSNNNCRDSVGVVLAADNGALGSSHFADDVIVENRDGYGIEFRHGDSSHINWLKVLDQPDATQKAVHFADQVVIEYELTSVASSGATSPHGNDIPRFTHDSDLVVNNYGRYVVISGTTNYDGTHWAEYVSATQFDVPSLDYVAETFSGATVGRSFGAKKNCIVHGVQTSCRVDYGTSNAILFQNGEGGKFFSGDNGMGIVHSVVIDRGSGRFFRTVPYDFEGRADLLAGDLVTTDGTIAELNGFGVVTLANAAEQSILWNFRAPLEWYGGAIDWVEILYIAGTGPTADVDFRIDMKSKGPRETTGSIAVSEIVTGPTSHTTNGIARVRLDMVASPGTPTVLYHKEGDVISVKVTRLGNADTHTGDARVIGITLHHHSNGPVDWSGFDGFELPLRGPVMDAA
ncbi:MAG: hypothetical protein LC634_03825 [Sphingomonadales bacterium]|nr:hypothetical protein [Sphingomonadales bacterium]